MVIIRNQYESKDVLLRLNHVLTFAFRVNQNALNLLKTAVITADKFSFERIVYKKTRNLEFTLWENQYRTKWNETHPCPIFLYRSSSNS